MRTHQLINSSTHLLIMIFKETKLKGAYTIRLEPQEDERGFFARSFCLDEFKKNGIDFNIVQCNISYNREKGTLRGMHYQIAPHQEAKLVSCIRGAIYDVIIDLRQDSPTYCQWFAVELTAHFHSHNHPPAHSLINPFTHSPMNPSTHQLLYIPQGFAHGFQTLEDDSVVFYQMSEFYHPEAARGVRWDDKAFGIKWLLSERIMSKKDISYPDFRR